MTNPHPLILEGEALLRQEIWPAFDNACYETFNRVLETCIGHGVGEQHFSSVTGYGHGDLGRDVTDKIFADVFQAEAALVRLQMVSGTHAISVAMNSCLRPGDMLLSIAGQPYDTLEEVIGLRGDDPQSLIGKGVDYQEMSVFKEGGVSVDFDDAETTLIQKARLIFIQRSKGYRFRLTLGVKDIQAICESVRQINPEAVILVDNCYGEFVEAIEPPHVGANLIAGSLIKNPGGSLVPSGGYIAGDKKWVMSAASVLTCPGIGPDGGYTFDLTRSIIQGLFLAPSVVKEALKGMTLAAYVFEKMGYDVEPHWSAPRGDIIQAVSLGKFETLQKFCAVVQSVSPVNAILKPVPAHVPGYQDELVMAGGTFIDGSTLELSADGPIREPYTVFLQGGISYAHTRYALDKLIRQL